MKPETNLRNAMDRRLSALHGTDQHVQQVLRMAKGEEPVKAKKRISVALVFAIIALVGVAVAATLSPTITWIEEMYGAHRSEVLQQGTTIDIGQTRTLGQVTYQWVDTVLSPPIESADKDEVADKEESTPEPLPGETVVTLEGTKVLSGTVNIASKEGENVVLIPEDYSINDPMGYNLFLGEKAPEGAKSYLDIAVERDAKILLAKAVPRGILIDGVLNEGFEVGFDFRTNKDGTLTYHYMIYGVPEGPKEHTIQMFISNWEITRAGQWLRGQEDEQGNTTQNTWLKEEWVLTFPQQDKK